MPPRVHGVVFGGCANAKWPVSRPRRQFQAGHLRELDADFLAPLLRNLEELSEVVADLETDGKGVPVLLRQYLQLGGTVLAFNVDEAFSESSTGWW